MSELLAHDTTEQLLLIKQADIHRYPKAVQVRWLLTVITEVIGEWQGEYQPTYAELAFELNCRDIRSPRGKPWTTPMLYNGLSYHGFFIGDISTKRAKTGTAAARAFS